MIVYEAERWRMLELGFISDKDQVLISTDISLLIMTHYNLHRVVNLTVSQRDLDIDRVLLLRYLFELL